MGIVWQANFFTRSFAAITCSKCIEINARAYYRDIVRTCLVERYQAGSFSICICNQRICSSYDLCLTLHANHWLRSFTFCQIHILYSRHSVHRVRKRNTKFLCSWHRNFSRDPIMRMQYIVLFVFKDRRECIAEIGNHRRQLFFFQIAGTDIDMAHADSVRYFNNVRKRCIMSASEDIDRDAHRSHTLRRFNNVDIHAAGISSTWLIKWRCMHHQGGNTRIHM